MPMIFLRHITERVRPAPVCFFLIDMQHRQLYISTGGEAVIRAFTDKKLIKCWTGFMKKAAGGDYYGSCVRFLRDVERYAPTAKKGSGRCRGADPACYQRAGRKNYRIFS